MRYKVLTLVCLFILTGNLSAQTSLNPDISVVGDFRMNLHNDSKLADSDKINLKNPQMEINVNGYLNPFVRADLVMGWHEGSNAEIEEFYATILKGLPLKSNLIIGKKLLGFGRLNPVHVHAYSFIKRPLVHEIFFGIEGLSDVTVKSSFLLPAGNTYFEFMIGITKGDVFHHHYHDHSVVPVDEPVRDPGLITRLTSSFAVSELSEISLGASAVNADFEIEDDKHLKTWLIGNDLKYKYKPSRYKSLQIETEFIAKLSDQPNESERLKSYGWYGYTDYRFNQKYNIGTILEWVKIKHLFHDEINQVETIHKYETSRIGLFLGFAPIEETSLVRLAGHITDTNNSDNIWEINLQFIISLGPHTPHNF